jgi:WhiB family redox-sensing transcriptional regulator
MKEDWTDYAKCKGMDTNVFFPKRGRKIDKLAIEACKGCPVTEPCLKMALENYIQAGYQAGMTAEKRREIVLRLNREGALSEKTLY